MLYKAQSIYQTNPKSKPDKNTELQVYLALGIHLLPLVEPDRAN